MSTLTLVFTPGEEKQINVSFKKLLILADGGAPIDIKVKNYQGALQPLSGVQAGFGLSSDDKPYTYVIISSATAQTVQFYLGDDDVVYNRLSGNVTVTGNLPGITNIVKVALESQLYGASYSSLNNLAVNTPETVFAPGANVNGAILHRASFMHVVAGGSVSAAFVAKSSAPVTVLDGDVICSVDSGGASTYGYAKFERPTFITAGKGLYFINTIAGTSEMRSVLYTLL